MIPGHDLLLFVPMNAVFDGIKAIPFRIDTKGFSIMLLTGFIAKMVDGLLVWVMGSLASAGDLWMHLQEEDGDRLLPALQYQKEKIHDT